MATISFTVDDYELVSAARDIFDGNGGPRLKDGVTAQQLAPLIGVLYQSGSVASVLDQMYEYRPELLDPFLES